MKKLNPNYIVSQDNSLIGARHSNTTETEAKLIAVMISTVEKNDDKFEKQRISVADFCELMGIKKPEYRHIKSAVEKLIGKSVAVEQIQENGRSKWIGRTWFSEIIYTDGEGVIEYTFSPSMEPYLLDLKEFTRYHLSNILSLKSSYSIRLYELSKQHQNKKIKTFSLELEELRKKIGATQKSYDAFGSFKQKILTPALQEIKNTTDIVVTYEEIKRGRKVVAIKFLIEPKFEEKKESKPKPIHGYKPRKRAPGKEEVVPEWFNNKDKNEPGKNKENDDMEKRRQQLLKELEEMEQNRLKNQRQ